MGLDFVWEMLGIKPQPPKQPPPQPSDTETKNEAFGVGLYKTTRHLTSMAAWRDRVRALEVEFDMKTPSDLWVRAHQDAMRSIQEYRDGAKRRAQAHAQQPGRIARAWRNATRNKVRGWA